MVGRCFGEDQKPGQNTVLCDFGALLEKCATPKSRSSRRVNGTPGAVCVRRVIKCARPVCVGAPGDFFSNASQVQGSPIHLWAALFCFLS